MEKKLRIYTAQISAQYVKLWDKLNDPRDTVDMWTGGELDADTLDKLVDMVDQRIAEMKEAFPKGLRLVF